MILKVIATIMAWVAIRSHTQDLIRANKAKGEEVSNAGRVGYLIAESGYAGVIIWAIWA